MLLPGCITRHRSSHLSIPGCVGSFCRAYVDLFDRLFRGTHGIGDPPSSMLVEFEDARLAGFLIVSSLFASKASQAAHQWASELAQRGWQGCLGLCLAETGVLSALLWIRSSWWACLTDDNPPGVRIPHPPSMPHQVLTSKDGPVWAGEGATRNANQNASAIWNRPGLMVRPACNPFAGGANAPEVDSRPNNGGPLGIVVEVTRLPFPHAVSGDSCRADRRPGVASRAALRHIRTDEAGSLLHGAGVDTGPLVDDRLHLLGRDLSERLDCGRWVVGLPVDGAPSSAASTPTRSLHRLGYQSRGRRRPGALARVPGGCGDADGW